jgi:hypothetical protein
MKLGSTKPAPSRLGKKQVIAFLQPAQAQAAYAKAARDDKTNQEIIGDALNAVFAHYGMPPPVQSGHSRIVRRSANRASIRTDGDGPSCRSGRVSYGGWFDEEVVRKLARMASEHSVSVQSIIEHGLELVTGIAPAKEEEGAFARSLTRRLRRRPAEAASAA